jgi:hypothetical protein
VASLNRSRFNTRDQQGVRTCNTKRGGFTAETNTAKTNTAKTDAAKTDGKTNDTMKIATKPPEGGIAVVPSPSMVPATRPSVPPPN